MARVVPWLLLLAWLNAVHGWGGLFNRFSPEMLSNMGYGGGGYRSSPLLQRFQSPNDVLQELTEAEEEPCYGKKCTANEHCCPGSVCVDVDGLVGSCLFAYGLKQGELCRRDADCETGLLCSETEGVGGVGGGVGGSGGPVAPRTCQPPITTRRVYGEDCATSGECDVARGLCCQLQRRHRQAPRKVCSYFKDPLICIGPVAAAQVKDDVEHTAGEKRLTAKTSAAVAAFNHLRRRK